MNEQDKPFHIVLNDATTQIPPEALGDHRFGMGRHRVFNSNILSLSGSAVQNIGNFALKGCTALKSVSFPVATTIEFAAFAECPFLESVYLPSVITIGADALKANCLLTYISLPSITTIDKMAFTSMAIFQGQPIAPITASEPRPWHNLPITSLTSILLPSVEKIDRCAFLYCTRLRLLQFPETPPALEPDVFTERSMMCVELMTNELVFLVPDPSKYVSLPNYPTDSAFVKYDFLTSSPHVVKPGDRLEITAEIPGVTISGWKKDGTDLEGTGSTYFKMNAEASDEGLYTAVFAMNDNVYHFPIEVKIAP
jgi:hypothetical protein